MIKGMLYGRSEHRKGFRAFRVGLISFHKKWFRDGR